jgi:hypothetical protein
VSLARQHQLEKEKDNRLSEKVKEKKTLISSKTKKEERGEEKLKK